MKYYPSSHKTLNIFTSIGALILVFCSILLGIAGFMASSSLSESLVNFILVFMITLIPITAWTGLVNVHPDVWLTDEGIYISVNIFWRVQIKWDSIKQIRELPQKKGVLLLARKITFFHREFGEKGLHGVILSPKSEIPDLINAIEKEVLSLSERMTKVI